MAFIQVRQIENTVVLRALIVVYLICALWFKVVPDTLPESMRAIERSLDKPHYELLDNIMVALLYARALLCLLLWSPTRLVAWLFASVVMVMFGLGAFGGPSLMSPADSLVDGTQAMTVPAILTVLFIGGVFGRARTAATT